MIERLCNCVQELLHPPITVAGITVASYQYGHCALHSAFVTENLVTVGQVTARDLNKRAAKGFQPHAVPCALSFSRPMLDARVSCRPSRDIVRTPACPIGLSIQSRWNDGLKTPRSSADRAKGIPDLLVYRLARRICLRASVLARHGACRMGQLCWRIGGTALHMYTLGCKSLS